MSEFVTVYAKSTGKKQRIPAHWIDHPVLGKDFALTPSQKAKDRITGTPDGDWKVAELEEYADAHGVDRTGLKKKADLLDAIASSGEDPSTDPAEDPAPQTPPTAPVDDKTPAAGDDKEN